MSHPRQATREDYKRWAVTFQLHARGLAQEAEDHVAYGNLHQATEAQMQAESYAEIARDALMALINWKESPMATKNYLLWYRTLRQPAACVLVDRSSAELTDGEKATAIGTPIEISDEDMKISLAVLARLYPCPTSPT